MIYKGDSLHSSWVQCLRPRPRARLRCFCFPYAGGGTAIFRPFAEHLPAEIEIWAVRLPGRETRFSEQPFTRMESLIPMLVEVLCPYFDRPFALFGHSMGALISFELARALRRDKQALSPRHLLVSAHRAPHLPAHRASIYQLPTNCFLAELHRMNGTSEEVLKQEELLSLLLPLLRSDFELCETYTYSPELPLSCALTAIGGLQDQDIPCTSIQAWREHSYGPSTLRFFPGDHFFIQQQQNEVLNFLAQQLLAL